MYFHIILPQCSDYVISVMGIRARLYHQVMLHQIGMIESVVCHVHSDRLPGSSVGVTAEKNTKVHECSHISVLWFG